MIQGGDPNSRGAALATPLGMGGPGYQIPAEIQPDLLHYKGALAAARQGDAVNPERQSSGSQFYLVHGRTFTKTALLNIEARNFPPEGAKYSEEAIERYSAEGGAPFLDNQYTVFGYVVEGLDVIDSIAVVETAAGDRPLQNVWMAMEIIE
jgi:peptidyl-prolyl cis-trans isomerase B (cyclophilin B)